MFTAVSTKLVGYVLKYKFLLSAILLVSLSFLVFYQVLKTEQEQTDLSNKISQNELLIASLSARARSLLTENNMIKSEDARAELTTIYQTIEKYETTKEKTASYKTQGADVTSVETELPKAVELILSKKYSEADTLLSTLDANLEAALATKLAADAAAKPKTSTTTSTCSSVPTSGYCRMTINGSTVDIVAANLSSVQVITDTAGSSTSYCPSSCPAKSLQSYVQAHGGYAGINGTYFCPPDYSSCASQVNTFTFPVYKSPLNGWVFWGDTAENLDWNNRAGMTFTSSSGTFHKYSADISPGSSIEAGITNYPGLVQNGVNITGDYELTSAQNLKGYRGGIGLKGNILYLVIARSVTVVEFANIMVSMGITHGLNLDGGGSSALYYNGYKVGPGRALPNALILK